MRRDKQQVAVNGEKWDPWWGCPVGCLDRGGMSDQGGSPQNDEFAILDGLLPWLCIFTRRRQHTRALVPRVLEI